MNEESADEVIVRLAKRIADADAKKGGSAFPFSFQDLDTGTFLAHPGMSLRDWYAGQALQGLAAYPGRDGEGNEPKHFARWAYALADAMLEARRGE